MPNWIKIVLASAVVAAVVGPLAAWGVDVLRSPGTSAYRVEITGRLMALEPACSNDAQPSMEIWLLAQHEALDRRFLDISFFGLMRKYRLLGGGFRNGKRWPEVRYAVVRLNSLLQIISRENAAGGTENKDDNNGEIHNLLNILRAAYGLDACPT
ncbi:MAG: hypothetical protein ISR48_03430 [Alphaproteobacteria bacterium]|nr:hypothetical protein [Alphaproteobacteria bacterium]